MESIIDAPHLATLGAERCLWFRMKMPFLRVIKTKFLRDKPLDNCTIAICMHIEPKTAVWIDTLLSGGAKAIVLIGCVGSTQPPTAAFLASLRGVTVFGKENDDYKAQQKYIEQALTTKKDLLLDNGGSMIINLHRRKHKWKTRGATEETRSGKFHIESEIKSPRFPIVVLDDSPLKQTLENNLGVGQSVVDGIMRATSLLLGGKKVLVIGYGWCGRGIASRLRGMGAITMIHDLDPVKLLQAKLEGNLVDSCDAMLGMADIIITVTGRKNVITKDHFVKMKNGVVLCNAGHFSNEINLNALARMAKPQKINGNIESYSYRRKTIFLLKKANLINLAAADGNPIEIMDMGLGLQALCAAALAATGCPLKAEIQPVPQEINRTLAELCLQLF